MSMTTHELQLLLGISLLGCLTSGWFSYVAWLRPESHQNFLNMWGSVFEGWYPFAQKFWISSFNFWLTRLSYTVFFVLCLYLLVSSGFSLLF